MVAAAVLVLARRPPAPASAPRSSFGRALPLVVFTAAALVGQRSIPLAGLVLVPGLAVGLAGIGRLDGRERSPVVLAAGVVLAVLATAAVATNLQEPSFDLRTYPTDGLAWLDDHGVLGAGARVAHEDTAGNLIELLEGTRARVFLDDRYDMYPTAVTRDYLDIHDGSARWAEALDHHRVQYLLWPRSSALAQLVAGSPDWRMRYQDQGWFVACRRNSHIPEC
jgi:hypothetical protein